MKMQDRENRWDTNNNLCANYMSKYKDEITFDRGKSLGHVGVGGGQRGNDDMYSKSCKDKQIVAGMTYCPVDERFGVSYSTTEVCTV